jgi:hypothetical protein
MQKYSERQKRASDLIGYSFSQANTSHVAMILVFGFEHVVYNVRVAYVGFFCKF